MVADAFFPDIKGGAARVVSELSRALNEKGHNLYVLTGRFDKRLPLREVIRDVHVFRYDVSGGSAFSFIGS